MAIYKQGTAELAANGNVTGTGTAWNAPLSLIRVGCTIMFLAPSAQLFTITAINSATSMTVANPANTVIPNAPYTILLSDTISVDGLAQDLAETLRFYQLQNQDLEDQVDTKLTKGQNLADLTNKTTARSNLGVPATGDVLLKNQTINNAAMANAEYSESRLSGGDINAKTYLRKFRGGGGSNIYHETVQGNFYRISTGVTDSSDFVSFESKGVGNVEGKLGGKTIVLTEQPNIQLASGFTIQNTLGNQSYVVFSIRNNGKEDNTSLVGIELPHTANLRGYLLQRERTGTANQIVNTFPSTSGTLAVQGTSGRDYKRDINEADPNEAMSRICSLDLKNFIYKNDDENRVRFGFIAEEAELIAPQYVKHNKELYDEIKTVDDSGEEKIEKLFRDRPSIDNNPIVMDLIGCVQALKAEIEELKKSLASK